MTENTLSHKYVYDEKWMQGSTEKYHYLTWQFWHHDRFIFRTACGHKLDYRKPTKHPTDCCKKCMRRYRKDGGL